MINAYKEGKDLYATVASVAFHNTYWDNMEHNQDGTPNPDGKNRRSKAKSIVLGIMYGRGAPSIAEQIGSSVEEAQSIIDSFYKGFPKVKQFTEQSIMCAMKNGYVEDYWGRRRRLPDMQLRPFVASFKNVQTAFNPLLGSSGTNPNIDYSILTKYENQLTKAKSYKEKQIIKQRAENDGVAIKDNNGFINSAQRQCTNARIQGSASTMTKIAMIKVYNDPILRELGFKLLIPVHDELIGECPKENAEQCADRLTELMKTCVPEIPVPFKCDPTIEDNWYMEDYNATIYKEYKELCKTNDKQTAFETLINNHTESSPVALKSVIDKNF